MAASLQMAIVTWAALALVAAEPSEPPATAGEPDGAETIMVDRLRQRMTVPISIGGAGPYRFIVDTGSERTVVSVELAARLQLAAGAPVTVHSMTEVSRVATAVVPELHVGRRIVERIEAPLIPERSLGADGLLGVDSLASQQVDFDFRTNEMRVTRSAARHRDRWQEGTIVVTARSRLGHLVLVDAALDGERVWVIIDTGAEVTIANEALRRRLERRGRLGPTAPIEVTSVTGGTRMVDYGVARRVRIGSVEIPNLPIGFADVHPFRKLDLIDRPAILLGMDALRSFEQVSLDFASREVRLVRWRG